MIQSSSSAVLSHRADEAPTALCEAPTTTVLALIAHARGVSDEIGRAHV